MKRNMLKIYKRGLLKFIKDELLIWTALLEQCSLNKHTKWATSKILHVYRSDLMPYFKWSRQQRSSVMVTVEYRYQVQFKLGLLKCKMGQKFSELYQKYSLKDPFINVRGRRVKIFRIISKVSLLYVKYPLINVIGGC